MNWNGNFNQKAYDWGITWFYDTHRLILEHFLVETSEKGTEESINLVKSVHEKTDPVSSLQIFQKTLIFELDMEN